MNYEVTSNRKRPRSFDGLVGQEFVVASLKNSLESGRIAHAYLFSGPRGVGKTSAARILARALNCPAGPTAAPCEDYPGSDEIARGAAIDVIEIDGASNTSVNDVRQIKDEVLFAPTTSRYKIYIIDEVHMLSNSAFNALLKTIEEPPPYIVFVFATTEIHKVPATIRSRCQQFNFRLIPVDLIAEKLAEAASESEVEADEDALFWVAKESTGSLRDAYTLFDQIVSFSDGHITLEKIRDKLGLVGLDNLNEIADTLADGDGQKIIAITDDVLSRGVSIDQFVIDLAEYFRSILFIRKGVRKESLLGFPADRFSGKLVRTLSDIQLERGLEILLSLYRSIRYSLNQRFDLDLAMSRLASLRDYLAPKDLLQEIQDIRDSMTGSPTPAGGGSSAPGSGAMSAGAGAAGSTGTVQTAGSSVGPGVTGNSPGVAGMPQDAGMSTDPGTADNTPSGAGMPPSPGSPASTQAMAAATTPVQSLGDDTVAAIIGAVRPTMLTLASALEKATSWRLSGRDVTVVFDSDYAATAARGDEETIRNAVSDVIGQAVLIRIVVQSADAPDGGAPQTDDRVEMVKRVFRGEEVKG